ncbi:RNA polymerase sigma factor [Streptomyces avicenniae]|uniref:RNA polymerase sigma factor n=1 Tax=Streptomyces avicenniae TaxID=500153 RepID=UPI000699D95D|nr:sigma-70 family RNA polymerase sigma factor [Streptomyces avicenniae]
MSPATTARAAVADAWQGEWSRIVGALIRHTGDWDLAEECAQDAFTRALERWPLDGVPARPGAWLMTTARNRAVDRLRRATVEAAKLRELAAAPLPSLAAGEVDVQDDRLRLIFTCCHPALSDEARVALTLRTVAGLGTGEIARAFLVSERTMGQRLFRAKSKIRHARIPFRVPPREELPARLDGVLRVLYLLFNEGYAATAGPVPVRADLTGEAIRLARLLAGLLPDEPEVGGLLALLLLQNARSAARTDAAGDFVPLADQDRSRWDAARIAEGVAVLDRALGRRRPGAYQVQAAVAACHATAPGPEETDWRQIALLYGELARWAPGPVVELNRAVAVAMAEGPAAGLALLAPLTAAGTLDGYHLLPATRADLLRRLGRHREAALAYREALTLATSDTDRRYLAARLETATQSAADGGRARPAG